MLCFSFFLTNGNSTTSSKPASSESCVIGSKYFGTANLLSKTKLRAYYGTTSGLYVSTKFQSFTVLLKILLQFTCRKTSDLPSIHCVPLVATHSSWLRSPSVPASTSFLPSLLAPSLPCVDFFYNRFPRLYMCLITGRAPRRISHEVRGQ